MTNLVDDFSQLTGTQKTKIDNIVNLLNKDIAHSVFEALSNNDAIININIGIGNLKISIEENKILYKFIPSTSLEDMVLSTVETNKSPLTQDIEQSLINLILETKRSLI